MKCCHQNTDFMSLSTACMEYIVLDMVLMAHLSNFSGGWEIPSECVLAMPTTCAQRSIVHFVTHVEGNIYDVNFDAFEEIKASRMPWTCMWAHNLWNLAA